MFINIRVSHENEFLMTKIGSTRSASIWGLLWRNPKGFLILTTFRGCTSHFRFDLFYIVDFHPALTSPDIVRAEWKFTIQCKKRSKRKRLVHPRKLIQNKDPFGILQSSPQILADIANLLDIWSRSKWEMMTKQTFHKILEISFISSLSSHSLFLEKSSTCHERYMCHLVIYLDMSSGGHTVSQFCWFFHLFLLPWHLGWVWALAVERLEGWKLFVPSDFQKAGQQICKQNIISLTKNWSKIVKGLSKDLIYSFTSIALTKYNSHSKLSK